MKRDDNSDGGTDFSLLAVRAEVSALLKRGWQVVRLLPGTKMAFEKDWPNLKRRPGDFREGDNVGVRFGPLSAGLCDVDLDYPQARALVGAKAFGLNHLPEFGRASLPAGKRGHRLVVCPDAPDSSRVFGIRSKEAKDTLAAHGVGLTVVEIRGSNGSQTAVPPSQIAGKQGGIDALVWTDPAGSDAIVPELTWDELNRRVGVLAFASLCTAIYPPDQAARTEFEQHFLGALKEAGISPGTAADMLMAVGEVAGDKTDYTLATLETPDATLASLLALLKISALERIARGWLGLDAPSITATHAVPEALSPLAKSSLTKDYEPGVISALQLKRALSFLDPADFAGYFDHLAVMLAAHHATGASGVACELFVEWSARNPDYGPGKVDERGKSWADVVRSAWRGAKLDRPNPVTLGTLLRLLSLAGAADIVEEFARQVEIEKLEDQSASNAGHADTAVKPWPRRLRYLNLQTSARHSRIFRDARPTRLISSDEVVFGLHGDGVWREVPEDALRAEIRATDPIDALSVNEVTAMVRGVRDLVNTSARPFEWIEPPANAPQPRDLVLFQNGLLDLRTGDILALDGSYFATGLPGVAYNPSATCPGWLTWLDDRLDASFHPTLQEWFGYVMVPDTTAHRFMTFTGPPRSGKSTAKNVLENLVGTAHIARKQLSDLGVQFGMQDALDKRLIVIPDSKDVPGGQRGQALERLLALTGGDTVGVPRKFKESVNAKLLTRLLVLGNRQPAWIDESGAMAARQIAITFDRSFEGEEDQSVEDKLMTELPGIANWALEGLRRLRTNGYRFTVGAYGKAAVADVRRNASPAMRFAEDRLEVTGNPEHCVLQDVVFEAYRQWGLDEGLTGREWRNKAELMEDIVTALHTVKATQKRGLPTPEGWEGGEYRPRVLVGVKSVKLDPKGAEDF